MDLSIADQQILADVRLRAAAGYIELGMLEEAWEELDGVEPGGGRDAGATKVRLLLLLREERWGRALEVAQAMVALEPGAAEGYIHSAYCLHELGRTGEAERVLEEGPPALERVAVYFYNLACYKSVRGEVKEAAALLETAVEMDGNLVEVARRDPDLAAVREMS
jgi:tetratricopeptide (TPR) repeat protein